jgi:protein tyrosine phosphatase
LPTQQGLLKLPPVLSVLNIPYINASLIQENGMSYIATQHPLSNTIVDFWKMILIEKPSVILMLNGFEYLQEAKAAITNSTPPLHPQYPLSLFDQGLH